MCKKKLVDIVIIYNFYFSFSDIEVCCINSVGIFNNGNLKNYYFKWILLLNV